MENKVDIKVGSSQFNKQTYFDVLSMLSSGAIPFTALASSLGGKDWMKLLSIDSFPQFLVNNLMIASKGYSYDSLFNHWYIKGRESSYGPFSLIQLLEFYHQNRLHSQDFIRHSSFSSWLKLEHSSPFKDGGLATLLECKEIAQVISRRRHPRISYTNEVFVSTRAELYRGVTWSLSNSGLGLVTDESTSMELNHRVNIIVNSNNEHGAVQVKGQVVNIKKETNYERVAIEFDQENPFLTDFILKRVPSVPRP